MRRVSFAWPVSDGCFARDSSSRRQARWANQSRGEQRRCKP